MERLISWNENQLFVLKWYLKIKINFFIVYLVVITLLFYIKIRVFFLSEFQFFCSSSCLFWMHSLITEHDTKSPAKSMKYRIYKDLWFQNKNIFVNGSKLKVILNYVSIVSAVLQKNYFHQTCGFIYIKLFYYWQTLNLAGLRQFPLIIFMPFRGRCIQNTILVASFTLVDLKS